MPRDNELTSLSLEQARDGLAAGKFSVMEIVEAHIAAFEAAGALNTLITDSFDLAREQANRSQEKLNQDNGGNLEGVPVANKDLFCTAGVKTGAASRILGDFTPTYTAHVSQKLEEEGAISLGKLNLDEFAMGSSTENSAYGPSINPWRSTDDDTSLSPGGSSGGSSAAVAARLCYGATATDTGGSIRQPASFTGTVGLKPTYGLCSRWGIIAFASSLDQAGPITRTVKDAALMLQAMAGHDPRDSTSRNVEIEDFSTACAQSVKGMTIGIPKEYRAPGMSREIEDLWQKGTDGLRDAGCRLVDVSLPHTRYALPAYYIIAPAEASSNLARYDGLRYGQRVEGKDLLETYELTRGQGFGDEVRRRILIGTYVLSAGYYEAYYGRALKVRTRIMEDFDQAWETCDALLTPTSPSAAFPLGDRTADPLSMYLNDVFTVPANLAGLPAISVPAGMSEQGLPLGLQLIAPALAEPRLFSLASCLEEVSEFNAQPDPWWHQP